MVTWQSMLGWSGRALGLGSGVVAAVLGVRFLQGFPTPNPLVWLLPVFGAGAVIAALSGRPRWLYLLAAGSFLSMGWYFVLAPLPYGGIGLASLGYLAAGVLLDVAGGSTLMATCRRRAAPHSRSMDSPSSSRRSRVHRRCTSDSLPPSPSLPEQERSPMRCIRSLLLIPLLVAAAAPPVAAQALQVAVPESVGMSSGRLERLTQTMTEYVEEERLPGAVVLVAREGRIVYLRAFGHRDREAGVAQRTDDIFRIASQTKAVVSAAIMILQEEGELLISHTLGRYLPEFAETTVAVASDGGGYEVVPARQPITIRDLLTHTSGISYGTGPAAELWREAGIFGWYFAHRDEPIRETVRRMAALPFAAQPREAFVYGYSTDILGAVVEVVSGQPLDVFLRQRIFEPLGMVDTRFYLPEAERDRLAVVYSEGQDGLVRAPDPGDMEGLSHVGQGHYTSGPRVSFSGGAGLLSTARDYARFLQAMLDGGELDGVRILSPKSVELMTVNHVGDLLGGADSGTGFGLGFLVVDDLGERGQLGSEGEFGWGGAYHSTYWVDPAEQLVVVYFTQLIPASVDDHARLRALVYQAITER